MNRNALVEKLKKTVALEYQGTEYYIVCRDLNTPDDPDDAEFFSPNVTVLRLYSENAGIWSEYDLHLDDLLDDPNLKLYTLVKLPLENSHA
jgi:hypothetical protein